MDKKLSKHFLILLLSLVSLGALVLIIKNNINMITRLTASVVDPETSEICLEEENSSNILHENGETVKAILDSLYAEKDSTCSEHYYCDKPNLPTVVEPDSCFTLGSDKINYTLNGQVISVEDAVKELYRIYNSANFCPQKYCKPKSYTITIINNKCDENGDNCTVAKTDTRTKTYNTTEPIAAEDYTTSDYHRPSSYDVRYDGNHILTFNHTKKLNVNLIGDHYSSSQIRAKHSGSQTYVYTSSSQEYMAVEIPLHSAADFQKIDSFGRTTSSSDYPGFSTRFTLSDSLYATEYAASRSTDAYINGSHGTYFIRTCTTNNSDDCTDAEELRPYVEVAYDLNGGTGDSSRQTKYVGVDEFRLHAAPTRTGYTFKGWAAKTKDGTQCQLCNGPDLNRTDGTSCDNNSIYPANFSYGKQELNVGNESWPCSSHEAYDGQTNVVYMHAIWNRDPWTQYQ